MSLTGLVALIAAATLPTDFPARVEVSAEALAALAEARFVHNTKLLTFCEVLHYHTTATLLDARQSQLTDDDAVVLAFFLSRNSALCRLE